MAGGQLVIRFIGDTRDFDGVTKSLGSKLQGIGRNLTMAITPAAAGAAIAFTRMGEQWDRAVHLSATSAGDFEETLDSVRSVGGRVTQSLGDTADALNNLADRTGLTGKPLEDLTKKFLDLERLTGEASATLIPNITRLFGDWSIATQDQAESMDQLWRLSEKSGITLSDLSGLMVQFGSPLRQLGLDFETTAAMFARFEQEGVNIETALPGLRMALKQFALAGREPAPALLETIDAIKNAATEAEANTLAFEIFGVRAGADLAAAIREGRFELDDYIDAMRDGTSTIDGASEAGTTLGDKFKMLGNRITAMLGPFGTLGSIVAGAVASLGPLIFGLGQLSKAFSGAGAAMRRFGGALKTVAWNPWTLAVGAAAVGLSIWADHQAEAKRRVEELTAAIESDTGAIGENTRQLVVNRLESEGALAAAQMLGLNLSDVTDAVLEGGGAWRDLTVELRGIIDTWEQNRQAVGRVAPVMDDQTRAAADLLEVMGGLGGELDAASAAAERQKDALGQNADATEDGIEPTTDFAEAIEGLDEEMSAAEETATQLTTALDALSGTQRDAEQAALAWLDSLADLKEELKGNADTLTINTQAGRDNRSQILASIEAAIAHGAAVTEETGSVEQGAQAVRRHINALIEEAVQAGVAEEEIRDYLAELNLTPKEIRTQLELLGIPQAHRELGRFFETWNGRTINVKLGVTTPSEVGGGVSGLAHGGIVRRPMIAMIGESGPEAVVPLSSGLPGTIEAPIVNNITVHVQGSIWETERLASAIDAALKRSRSRSGSLALDA